MRSVETIRYYEKIGLLPKPDRETSGYRAYRNAHLNRLLFIKRCRNLDMAQDEIRELIRLSENPEADCHEVDALLARHLEHVRHRLKELSSLEKTCSNCKEPARMQVQCRRAAFWTGSVRNWRGCATRTVIMRIMYRELTNRVKAKL